MIETTISTNQAVRRFDRRHLLLLIFSFCMVATLSFLIMKGTELVRAGRLDGFRPGNIISDYVMSNYKSMSEAEIQAFLKSKNSCNDTRLYLAQQYSGYQYHIENGHFVCMADERFGGESAAHIIWQAAQDYRINPQVLIVLLQKEQSLVTDTWPNHIQYRAATGYGCPDTAACSEKYYGFKNQVRRAAEMFRTVLNGGWTNYPVGYNYVQYNPNAACGGTTVYIENLATSALYRYTPYQPNASALAAGYGRGDGCGAYGNRNFYLYFLDWFGNPQGFSAVQTSLPAGDYYIAMNGDYEKVLQLDSDNKNNGTKFMLASRKTADTFTLQKNANGTYTLIDQYSGRVIDVPNAAAANGTVLHQYDANGTAAQQWYLYDNTDGTFSLGSAVNRELVLSIDQDEESATYKRLVLGYYNYSPNQSFRFIQTKPPVADGTYFVNSGLGSNLVIDIAGGAVTDMANAQVYTLNRTDAQKFQFTFDQASGTYTLMNVKANKALDVYIASNQNGANIQLYTSNQSNAQRWYIYPLADGKYELVSACSNKAADVTGAGRTPGTNLQTYQRNGSAAQSWTFTTEDQLPDTLEGTYTITSSLRDKFALDVAGGARTNGANVQLYDANGTEAQRWKLVYNMSDDTYTIINPISNLALDVAGGAKIDGANVWLYSQNGTAAQKWFIYSTADGYYEIVSAHAGKALDVAGAGRVNKSNAQIYTRNNTPAQKWTLIKE